MTNPSGQVGEVRGHTKRKVAVLAELELGGEKFAVVWVGDLDPDYRREPKTPHFCCLCQRDIKTPINETAYLHWIDGGNAILSVRDEQRHAELSAKQYGGQFPGEMGSLPVGADCARKLPREFVHGGAP